MDRLTRGLARAVVTDVVAGLESRAPTTLAWL